MTIAQEEAIKAYHANEVPVGAVLIDDNENILAQTHNTKENDFNPVAHAEMLAIQKAAQALSNWRLSDCSLYVTLEPCPMCMGAIYQSRIKNLYFGAYDKKGGALSNGLNLNEKSFNHKINIYGGLNHYENSQLLSQFFKQKRQNYKNVNQ
jgi:tRNA(adenine34) deaminase